MRVHFSIRTVLMLVIGILNVLVAAPLGYMTYKSVKNYKDADDISQVSEVVYHLYDMEKYLSLERATAFSFLLVRPDKLISLKEEMQESREKADKAYRTALVLINGQKDSTIISARDAVKKSYSDVQMFRLRLDSSLPISSSGDFSLPDQYYAQLTGLIANLNALIDSYSRRVVLSNFETARHMRFMRLIWEVSEYAGREYAIWGRLIAQNQYPDRAARENLLALRERIKYGLELAHGAVASNPWRAEIAPALEEAETHYVMMFEQLKEILYQPAGDSEKTFYPIGAEMWLQLASEAVNSLHEMTDAVLAVNRIHGESIRANALRSIYVSLFLFICALGLSFYMWWLVTFRVVRPINAMVDALYEETRLSDQKIPEQPRTDEISMLKQVLKAFQENSRQLQSERDKAQAASVAKGEFLANMSHEIRTPMNVVVGLSNILSRSRPLTEKQSEYIKMLLVNAETLLSLINDLLDFSKIEARSLEMEKVPFNLDRLLEDMVLIKSFKAKQKGLVFKTDIEDIQGKTYIGDPTRLRQVLVNLCGNAIKFTHSGSITLKVRAHPHAKPGYETIALSVADTGIGIPENKLESIFEKFTQADASIIRKYGGTGLGLAITKSLVEMMGGKISVESKLGEGTVFYVSFPLMLKAQQALFSMEEKAQNFLPPDASRPHGKILVVEDYYPNAVVVSSFLEEFGYDYDTAANGQQAVQKFMENDYDTVLMDIQMPGMDGYEATRAIRKYETEKGARRVRIIGLTAHVSMRDRQKCLESGMDDYLPKPFEHSKLREKLAG